MGGSFNPAHSGHRLISELAIKRLGLNKVWWLVSPQNPLKPSAGMANIEERVKTAVKISRNPKIKVMTIESFLGTQYTSDLLKILSKRFSSTRFIWIMGADNLVQFRQWKRYKDIIDLLPIAVIDRPSYSYQAISAGRHLFTRRHTARQLRRRLAKTRQDMPGWCFVAGQRHNVSATNIRKHRDKRQSRKVETQKLDI